MKTCLRHTTGACNEVTLGIMDNRVNQLTYQLQDMCPEIYCDECLAQTCISNLQKQLQYGSMDICRYFKYCCLNLAKEA